MREAPTSKELRMPQRSFPKQKRRVPWLAPPSVAADLRRRIRAKSILKKSGQLPTTKAEARKLCDAAASGSPISKIRAARNGGGAKLHTPVRGRGFP